MPDVDDKKITEISERIAAMESTINIYLVPTVRFISGEIVCMRNEMFIESKARVKEDSRAEGRFDITSVLFGGGITIVCGILLYMVTR